MSFDLYPYEALRSPQSVRNVDQICEEIHAACQGFGTNESRLLKAMGSQTPEDRCKVHLEYKEKYGKDLLGVIRGECGNRAFGKALQFLSVDPVAADCLMIDEACKHVGTNELLLFTILCGRTNKDMETLKKKYFDMYAKDLGRTLDSELSGSLEKLLFNSIQASQETFDPSYHTDEKLKKDCEQLHKDGLANWGTNEKGLFKFLCAAPPEELQKMDMQFAAMYGHTLTKSVELELSGQAQSAALFLLGMKINPYEQAAKLIDTACKGFGTNDLLLTSALIRYQIVMKQVSEAHSKLYSKTIVDRVKSETSGDFESILVEIVTTGEA